MNKSKQLKGNLGTFGGVFTPSILTILGLILFLRLGYVVGSGGIYQALLILALVSFFIGGLGHWQTDLLVENRFHIDNGPTFWVLFAIFSPP